MFTFFSRLFPSYLPPEQVECTVVHLHEGSAPTGELDIKGSVSCVLEDEATGATGRYFQMLVKVSDPILAELTRGQRVVAQIRRKREFPLEMKVLGILRHST